MDRKIYPSASQKRSLSMLLEADEELRSGKFSSIFTKKEAERRWIKIADHVNGIGGAVKTAKEWRKTWQDMKSKSKKKQSALNRAATATGGGPPPPPLTEEESIVLRTISKDSISGHGDSQESVVEFIDQGPSTSKQPSQGSTASLARDETPQNLQDIILDPPEQFRAIQETNKDGPNNGQETPAALPKGKKQKTAAKRLQESIEVAKGLESILKEKNEYKKAFYMQYIEEMKKQTNALLMIAESLKHD